MGAVGPVRNRLGGSVLSVVGAIEPMEWRQFIAARTMVPTRARAR